MADKRILLLDHKASIAKAQINDIGIELIIAKTGKEAIEILSSKEETFNLLILSSELQDLTVTEFFDIGNATLENKLPPILIGSRNDKYVNLKIMGSNGFIFKPVDLDKLPDIISELFTNNNN
jgi:DNA-binding NtrC family response regulator